MLWVFIFLEKEEAFVEQILIGFLVIQDGMRSCSVRPKTLVILNSILFGVLGSIPTDCSLYNIFLEKIPKRVSEMNE